MVELPSDNHSSNLKNISTLIEPLGQKRTIHGRNFYHDKKIAGTENIQKLKHFSECVLAGVLPDGEVMEFMALAISGFLDGRKRTLESAFELKSKPKKGTAAQQYVAAADDMEMFITMLFLMAGEKLSKEKAAQRTLERYEDHDTDVGTFTKRFDRAIPNSKPFIKSAQELLKAVKDNKTA